MAFKFHTKNGATLLNHNETSYNFEYELIEPKPKDYANENGLPIMTLFSLIDDRRTRQRTI